MRVLDPRITLAQQPASFSTSAWPAEGPSFLRASPNGGALPGEVVELRTACLDLPFATGRRVSRPARARRRRQARAGQTARARIRRAACPAMRLDQRKCMSRICRWHTERCDLRRRPL